MAGVGGGKEEVYNEGSELYCVSVKGELSEEGWLWRKNKERR